MGPFLVVKLYVSVLVSENNLYKPKCGPKRMDLRLPVRDQWRKENEHLLGILYVSGTLHIFIRSEDGYIM